MKQFFYGLQCLVLWESQDHKILTAFLLNFFLKSKLVALLIVYFVFYYKIFMLSRQKVGQHEKFD